MHKEDKDLIIQNYDSLLAKYGDNPQAVQWRDAATQDLRFKALVEVDDLNGKKLLDFGCGKADLFYYLKSKSIRTDYTGIDISKKMIEFAKSKNPALNVFCHDIFQQKNNDKYDYAVVSGTFNNRISDNWNFIFRTLETLWPSLKMGISFNLITSYVDYEEAGLFYADPRIILDYLKKNLTKFVTIRNDYMPYDYTVYAYKEARK